MVDRLDRLQVHLPEGVGAMLKELEDRLGLPKRFVLAQLIRQAYDGPEPVKRFNAPDSEKPSSEDDDFDALLAKLEG